MKELRISITEENFDWLQTQVDKDKSELINQLITRFRREETQFNWLKKKLKDAERGGFTLDNKESILSQSKSRLNSSSI